MTSTIPSQSAAPSRLHPLVATAAVSLTLFSAVGIAALTGLLPVDRGQAAAVAVPPAPTFAPAAASAAPATPAAPAAERIVVVERPAAPAAKKAPAPATAVATPVAVPVAQRVATSAPVACLDCGVVESLRSIEQAGEGSGLGAVAGGAVGGLLGNQLGKGGGKTLATVLGIAGGAYAGHQIEKAQKKTLRYEIAVRMEDGSLRTVIQETRPVWREGERVRFENGALVPNYARSV